MSVNHTPQLAEIQAAYDAENKAVLRQLERDFAEQRTQIVWAILKPTPLQAHSPEELANKFRFGGVFACIFSSVAWWAFDHYFLENQISTQSSVYFYGMFVFWIVLGLFLLFLPIQKIYHHKYHYLATYIHLDLLRETVTIVSPNQQYPTTYSFHSKSMLPKRKLPAFRLPETEQNEYNRLAEKLQRKISDLTGLVFEEK